MKWAEFPPALLAAAVLLIGGGLSTGCASTARHAQQDLARLEQRLPGRYGSTAVLVNIAPVTAQAVGDDVYYVRESDARDSRLVLWQGIWTLSLDSRTGTVIQRSYLFAEPRRWVRVAQDPDLLLSLLPQDLRELSGCELAWHATPAGLAASSPGACAPGREAQGLWLPRQAVLTHTSLMLRERRVDAEGRLQSAGAALKLDLTRLSQAGP